MKTLIVKNLQIKYINPSKEELIICDELSLEFKEGEIIGVFGPNGSGKTSLLRVLLGLKESTLGSVIHFDNEIIRENTLKRAYIPQDIQNSFFGWLSLKNNITLVSKNEKSSEKLTDLWNDFGINFKSTIKPSDCSGGMLQQSAIIRAFINDPEIIIGDEPFSALDVSTAGRMRSVFRKKIKTTKAIAVLALHNLDDLLTVCDKVLFIPNKPYSSGSKNAFHQIKIYNNPHAGSREVVDKEYSLTHTLERFFE